MRKIHWLAPAIALVFAACSSGGGTMDNTMGGGGDQPDMAPEPPDLYIPPYPTGNYGIVEGRTMFDITGQGYNLDRDHTGAQQSVPWGTIKLDQLHFNPACSCIILSISALWCGPCNQEQDDLVKAVSDDPSLCVFNVLIEGGKEGVAATMADVDTWTQFHDQNYPVIMPNGTALVHLPRPDALPTNLVIRPIDMQILSVNAGLGPTTISDAKALCAGM